MKTPLEQFRDTLSEEYEQSKAATLNPEEEMFVLGLDRALFLLDSEITRQNKLRKDSRLLVLLPQDKAKSGR